MVQKAVEIMTREEFQTWASGQRILLDGATGSNLMAAGMPRGACPERWTLAHPDVLLSLQRGYVQAGCQILYAPTFTANAHYLAMHGEDGQLWDINRQLVSLSWQAAGNHAKVAGDMTTLGQRELADTRLFAVYVQQAKALVDGGVDLFVVETMLGSTETVLALEAIRSVCDLPVLCTLTVEADGRTWFGDDGVETCAMLAEMGADAVGVNCSCGPEGVVSMVSNLSKAVSVPVVAKPNAGMPEILPDGTTSYSMTPEIFASQMQNVLSAGASMVGGCCGTTPAHLLALSKILRG